MAVLYVTKNFPYKGKVFRCGEHEEDATITVSRAELEEEKARGRHPKTKRWLSPLMCHCLPADAEAHAVMSPEAPPPIVKKEPDHAKIEELRSEFDKIGKAYDRRWAESRLKRELRKAKKEVGA